MDKGTVLRWKEPQSIAEEAERFILMEDRGERLLVTDVALQAWPIPPQASYKTADLVEATEECEACGATIPENNARHLGGMIFCMGCADRATTTQKEMDK
jgi:formylmethanofuran dehydrogenase subunit E